MLTLYAWEVMFWKVTKFCKGQPTYPMSVTVAKKLHYFFEAIFSLNFMLEYKEV